MSVRDPQLPYLASVLPRIEMAPLNQSTASGPKWARVRVAAPAFWERVRQSVIPNERQVAYQIEKFAFPARLPSLVRPFYRERLPCGQVL